MIKILVTISTIAVLALFLCIHSVDNSENSFKRIHRYITRINEAGNTLDFRCTQACSKVGENCARIDSEGVCCARGKCNKDTSTCPEQHLVLSQIEVGGSKTKYTCSPGPKTATKPAPTAGGKPAAAESGKPAPAAGGKSAPAGGKPAPLAGGK